MSGGRLGFLSVFGSTTLMLKRPGRVAGWIFVPVVQLQFSLSGSIILVLVVRLSGKPNA